MEQIEKKIAFRLDAILYSNKESFGIPKLFYLKIEKKTIKKYVFKTKMT